MNRQEFKEAVATALDGLPLEFQDKLDNVDIVVEELPAPHQLTSLGLKHPLSLFGLYQGVPLTKRTSHYGFVAPDKITLFRLPITLLYRRKEAIVKKIQAVLLHEIGHHFGLSEEDLAARPAAH